jgi:hypothetical protein
MEEAQPPHAKHVTASRLKAFPHPRQNQRSKGRATTQGAYNRTMIVHPFDFVASDMEAQACTSCNRRVGYCVQGNRTATCANATSSRLRNQCRDSRQPCA